MVHAFGVHSQLLIEHRSAGLVLRIHGECYTLHLPFGDNTGKGVKSLFFAFQRLINPLRDHTDCRVVKAEMFREFLKGVLVNTHCTMDLLIPCWLVVYIREQLIKRRSGCESLDSWDLYVSPSLLKQRLKDFIETFRAKDVPMPKIAPDRNATSLLNESTICFLSTR